MFEVWSCFGEFASLSVSLFVIGEFCAGFLADWSPRSDSLWEPGRFQCPVLKMVLSLC